MGQHLTQRGRKTAGAHKLLLARQQPRDDDKAQHRQRREREKAAAPADVVDKEARNETAEEARRRRRNDGFTSWSVKWTFEYKDDAVGCAIARVSATVEATIAMPQLKADASTPAALVRAFADYSEKLLQHEKLHVRNAIDIARRIENVIRATVPERTCNLLGRFANSLGDRLLKEAVEKDRDYDDRTDHGRKDGARFP